MQDDRRLRILSLSAGLAALEGALALLWLLSASGSLSLSSGRLALAAPALLGTLGFMWATVVTVRRPASAERFLGEVTRQTRSYGTMLAVAGLVVLGSIGFLLTTWKDSDPYVSAYLVRLAPYALWALLLGLQIAFTWRWLRYGAIQLDTRRIQPVLVVVVLLLALSAFITMTKLGLAPDLFAWGDPGVPILSWQVILTLGITGAGWLAISLLRRAGRFSRVLGRSRLADFLICLVLWGGAVWRWGAEPLRPSYFSPQPLPPNNEFYPYSDAATYDAAAQGLLTGYGLGGDVVRPFYSFFLAVVQAVHGTGYQNVLDWQIPVLALIPSLLYLIGKRLHSGLAGFFVGLLAIVQNENAIALAGVTNVSHAKLLMSDVPTTLGVLAVVTVILLWLRDPAAWGIAPLIAGGILGLVMLVRVQVVVLIPSILLVIWLASRKSGRRLYPAALWVAGLACVLLPWLWRNARLSGSIALTETSQTSQIGLIGQRYSLVVNDQLGHRLPGENEREYTARMLESAVRFIREHPGETARFISAHFLHNEVATFLVLPSSLPVVDFLVNWADGLMTAQDTKPGALWQRCCALRITVKNSPYWTAWEGEIPGESTLPMWIGLLALSTGIGVAWRRDGLATAFPIAVNLSYSLGNALVRNSGWRFNQPVDWVSYLFYGIGLVQLGRWGIAFFLPRASLQYKEEGKTLVREIPGDDHSRESIKPDPDPSSPLRWGWVLAGGLGFFLLSAAIPLTEHSVPERYANMRVGEVLSSLEAQGMFVPAGVDLQTLQAFLTQGQAESLFGRELYPRYYEAGQGEFGSGWPSFARRDYARLGFFLVGPVRRHIVLRSPEAPANFPNAADVLVLGCSHEDYLDAALVVLLEHPPTVLLRSPVEEWRCP